MKKLLLVTALSFSASFAHAEAPAAGMMDSAPAPAATFSEIDSDKDGKISRQEASAFSAVEIGFENADVNKDGTLDIQEFSETEIKPAK